MNNGILNIIKNTKEPTLYDLYQNGIGCFLFGSLENSIYIIQDLKLGTSTLEQLSSEKNTNNLFWVSFSCEKNKQNELKIGIKKTNRSDKTFNTSLIQKKIIRDIKNNHAKFYFMIKNPFELYISGIITNLKRYIYSKQNISLYNSLTLIEQNLSETCIDRLINGKRLSKDEIRLFTEYFETLIKSDLNHFFEDPHIHTTFTNYLVICKLLHTEVETSNIKLLDINNMNEFLQNEFGLHDVKLHHYTSEDVKFNYKTIIEQIQLELYFHAKIDFENIFDEMSEKIITNNFLSLELLESKYRYYKSSDDDKKSS